eukprot:scaffold65606_cov23-Tisochrysis_lutea.AAC.2
MSVQAAPEQAAFIKGSFASGPGAGPFHLTGSLVVPAGGWPGCARASWSGPEESGAVSAHTKFLCDWEIGAVQCETVCVMCVHALVKEQQVAFGQPSFAMVIVELQLHPQSCNTASQIKDATHSATAVRSWVIHGISFYAILKLFKASAYRYPSAITASFLEKLLAAGLPGQHEHAYAGSSNSAAGVVDSFWAALEDVQVD